MTEDLVLDDELAADASGDAGEPASKAEREFGMDFEFDMDGIEPGLELDRSALEKPAPQPPAPAPAPVPPPAGPSASPAAPAPPASMHSAPDPRPPRPVGPPPVSGSKPMAAKAIAAVVAILLLAIVGASLMKSEPEPPPNLVPQQALEEGERAIHQGKWVDALKAFKRLHRFPNSDEATAVRERGLEEKAFNEIMKAEPSSTSVRRLEQLSELYPDRPEVRDRLGEVRKALSSGARGGPPAEGAE